MFSKGLSLTGPLHYYSKQFKVKIGKEKGSPSKSLLRELGLQLLNLKLLLSEFLEKAVFGVVAGL